MIAQSCEDLLHRLRSLGVVLSIENGQLSFDAPRNVFTPELLAEMRAHRDELRAIIKQGDAPALLPLAFGPIRGVTCPYCRRVRFVDEPEGWRCLHCGRLGFQWIEGGSIVRSDHLPWISV
ncbi:MAG: hypothetical protein ACK5QT_00035 [Oligoflexia bacterium]|jgi:hypothetical protein